MLLVIIGHTTGNGVADNLVRGLIFSFHMPLFFVLSGFTSRYSADPDAFRRRLKHRIRHLLSPILIVSGIWIARQIFLKPARFQNLAFWQDWICKIIVGSGVPVTFGNYTVKALGVPWFYYALFFGSVLYDFIRMSFTKEQKYLITFLLSAFGVIVSTVSYLPMSLDIALAIQPFFLFGELLQDWDIRQSAFLKLLIGCFVWILLLWVTYPDYSNWTYLELAARRYTYFPLCFVCAAAGVLSFCELAFLYTSYLKPLSKPFLFLGQHSWYLLIIHCLDTSWSFVWQRPYHPFISAGIRFMSDLVLLFLLVLLKNALRAHKDR